MTMSDRIAVMNDGNFEQVGTPDDLYDRPANRFVAQFIGSPAMNFLLCEVVASDGEDVTVSIENTEVVLETGPNDLSPGDQVELGFRPEAVELDPREGYVSGTVSIVERIDDRMLATIDGPQGEVMATVPSDRSLAEDEDVMISFSGARTHLFDVESGENVQRQRDEAATPEV